MYKIHIEGDVVVVTKSGPGSVYGYYFDKDRSASENAHELYDLLAGANLEVKFGEG